MEKNIEKPSTPVQEWQQTGTIPTANLVASSCDPLVPGIPTAETTEVSMMIPEPCYVYIDEDPTPLIAQDSVPLASGNEFSPAVSTDNRIDREQARTGTRMGRLNAELEREGIQRARQDIRAIHYYASAAVEEGNRIAAYQNQNVNVSPQEEVVGNTIPFQSANLKEEPELYTGTSGKDYKVSPYEVSEYDTGDYEVSRYKSVYES